MSATHPPWVEMLAGILRGVPALADAACAGRWELFSPPEGTDEDQAAAEDREAQAVEICRTCPELARCQTWAASLPRSKIPAGVIAGQINRPAPVGRATTKRQDRKPA